MSFIAILFFVVSLYEFSTALITIVEGEVGSPLTLDLGNNVSVWARKLVGNTKTQLIARCSETIETNNNETNCNSWTDSVNNSGSRAVVTAEGRLLIEKLTKEDVGVYFSPNEKPHIYRTKTGYYVMPPNVIQVLIR